LNKITRGTPWSRFALILFNLHKIGKLILRKIIEIAATKCYILKLKCTKFDFGTPLEELTTITQAALLDLRGLFLSEGRMRRKGKGGERGRGSKGSEGREERRGEENKGEKEKRGEGLRHGCWGDGRHRV